MEFTKLSQLTTFTVSKVWGYKFKKWDDQNKKMLVSESWVQDFTKKWDVDTDKGKLDLSNAQFAQMLSGCFDNKEQSASPVGKTFSVKTNGKTGMDIRYFINLVRDSYEQVAAGVEEQINTSDFPF